MGNHEHPCEWCGEDMRCDPSHNETKCLEERYRRCQEIVVEWKERHERATAEGARLREYLAIYANQDAWTAFVPDSYRGECWEFDWDGDLGDKPWEMADRALTFVSGKQEPEYKRLAKKLNKQIDDLGVSADLRQEPGAEEGGEDVFGLPEKCVLWECRDQGELIVTCISCGTSYGPANESETVIYENR